ncbi:hypothetical protein N0V88_003643 [Collariella sp. IMI 366227]|nr:hypothetical protein N0V88_003643 [Collariella sp. IMI 366227]
MTTNGSAVRPATVSSKAAKEQEKTPAEVPAIAVIQPTPTLGSAGFKAPEQYFDVPGGFPQDESDQSAKLAVKETQQVVEGVNPAPVVQQLSPPVQAPVEPASTGYTTDSESSIYSDAYEDLSDMEAGGFQSLDAVIGGPTQEVPRPVAQVEHVTAETNPHPAIQPAQQAPKENTPQKVVQEPPKFQTELSSATTAVETQTPEVPQDEWEKAKAYWKSLTAERRAQLEREAMEEGGIDADMDEAKTELKPKVKKSVERRNSERKALAVHMAQQMMAKQQEKEKEKANPNRSYMIKPGEKWTGEHVPPMRRTLRDEPKQQAPQQAMAPAAEGSRLRKSMRTGGSPVKRRGSTGSESSFKRSRSARAQGGGFRHSLRPTSPPSGDARAAKRFSLRTLSPTGSAQRQSADVTSPVGTQMRTTLCDSSTGRKSPTGMRIPSFSLSYGGSKKGGSGSGTKTIPHKASASRFSSRLADSSDDEEKGGRPLSSFRSRFEESSDDEPVMPIPAVSLPKSSYPTTGTNGQQLRKESSVASTALPEELEESLGGQPREQFRTATAVHQPATTIDTTPRHTRSGRGQLAPTFTPTNTATPTTATKKDSEHTPQKKRSSILSVLRHHRKKDAASKVGKQGRLDESAARRDTRLERGVGELERIRSRGEDEEDDEGEEEGAGDDEEGYAEVEEQPYQHQYQHQRSSTVGSLGTRTLSTGGVGPFLPQRRMSAVSHHHGGTVESVDGSVAGASSTTARKKRFGALRRMFRLDD